jgi:hypothetical protein
VYEVSYLAGAWVEKKSHPAELRRQPILHVEAIQSEKGIYH